MTQRLPIAVVTGASRGAGRGIALALGAAGYQVYVTGRTHIDATAAAIERAGGQAVAVTCDHRDDAQTRALFERIDAEHGRLDILVNNAAFIHADLAQPGPFWQKPLELVDILDVGLRSTYVASFCAAPLLLANGRGLIVNTSSFGARCYMHGPAYGAQKAAQDKLAHDMAHDLRPHGVAVLSLWMGMLRTERTEQAIARDPHKYAAFAAQMETPQLTGRVIDALYRDPHGAAQTGRTLVVAEAAAHYGLRDDHGSPPSHRERLGDPIEWSGAVIE